MPPTVSLVAPFYGVEDYLRPCLESIRRQTFTDFECLLVDDGSPDGSAAIAHEVAAADARFRVVTQENQGLGAARNTGTDVATGRYLMFPDSDDLLAPRALEQLVTSLEHSGSDFAAAHVWRLSLQRGVEPSAAHVEPFAERRSRTSIRELPLLMRDRMVWNKLWRRSFWDEGGYRFPAIRFEDYPVTLRAHLEATAVDLLPDPVYVWRERPTGESISGRGHEIGNVTDRVTAALSVLDTVDALGTREVRELVHSHLVDVDLREVLASLHAAVPEERPAIEKQASLLVERVDAALVGLARPQLRLAYRAVRDGDVDTMYAVAAHRAGDRSAQTVHRVDGVRRRDPRRLARRAVEKGVGRARSARGPLAARPRSAAFADQRLDGLTWTVRAFVPLSEKLTQRVTATVGAGSVTADVAVTARPEGLVLDATFDTLALATQSGRHPLQVDVTAGPLRWTGGVTASEEDLLGYHRAGYWVQTVVEGGRLAVTRFRRAVTVLAERRVGTRVLLRCDAVDGVLMVQQPWPGAGVELPLVDGLAELDLAALVLADPADNPVTEVAARRLVLRTETGDEAVRLRGSSLTAEVNDREVLVKRATDGTAFVVHRPLTKETSR